MLGVAAVAFSLLYVASDVIEAAQDGFSTVQLLMTLVAEAAIPFLVVGLYAVQRPGIGRLGLAGALAYAYAYVFFTGTVVYALVESTPDFEALNDDLGVAMTLHGAIMLLGGLALGAAVIRARALPAWTGGLLIAGVVLVVAASGLSEGTQTAAAAVRASAFAAMGLALLGGRARNNLSRYF
jgi:hypothetical protein